MKRQLQKLQTQWKQRFVHTYDGFTLIEILIVVAIIAILAVIALFMLNPTQQRYKLYDVQRRRDLSQLKGLYQLFFDQHHRFPTGAEVCFDSPVNEGDGSCSCHICGLEQDVGTFSNFLQKLYCDPEHPRKSYLYQYECTATPGYYKIYATLSQVNPEGGACSFGVTNRQDDFLEPYPNNCETTPGTGSGGGGGGGGGPTATPTPSPTPGACPADPVPKYCRLGGICNICGTFANCTTTGACDSPTQLFSDSLCNTACSIP